MSGENIKEFCGVFGIYNHPQAAYVTQLGLFALQHRGEEAAGICTSDGNDLYIYKSMGLVGDALPTERLANLKGHIAIGHTRYSTTGSSKLINAQPYRVDYSRGQVAVAHNGNLVNAQLLRSELEAYGSIFGSTMDSEIFVHLIAKPSYRNCEEAVVESVKRVEGAYSLVILNETQLIGVRDPYGFRPLCFGKLGESYVLASESCAFDLIEAEYIRDVEPGEVIVIDEKGVRSHFPFGESKRRKAQCIFEHVYFSRPDSLVFGDTVGLVREKMGMNLAKEHPANADLVIPVPDSGNFAAMGFSKASGISLGHGFTRNHYIGRTFINPVQEARSFKVKIKINPIRKVVEGKRIVVVDDSIVRGNTAKSRVSLLRRAGAREVHMRISCPPHISPCYYGIDFPSKEELLACNKSMEEIKKFLDVDSLGYLSLEGMLAATSKGPHEFCTACFTGNYPTEIPDGGDKFKLEKKRKR
ncbi:MAG: amidophosphoribosyltransferase [Candidatus Omnitrophica bacterium]|nr:amidophosphoribosyltransferase [Candidatus Omnitrophota bacterium]